MHKDSLLIFTNKLFVNLSLVISTYLFAQSLAPAQLGLYQNFWVQFNIFYAVAGLGISSFIFSYTPDKVIQIFRNLNTNRKVLGIGLIVLCAALFAFIQFKAGASPLAAGLFLIFNTLSIFTDSFLTIFKKFKALVIINVLFFLCFVSIHLWILKQPTFDFNTLIWALLLLSVAKVIVSLRLIGKAFAISGKQAVDNNKYLRLWTHIYLFDLVQLLVVYADKFIISILTDASVSVVYQNGTYPIPFVPILFMAVSSVTLMRITSESKDNIQEANVLSASGKILATAVIPVFFYFMFFADEFIRFYFTDKYVDSIPIFRMSLLMLLFKVFNFTLLFQRKEMGAIINKGVVVDIVCLVILVYPCYYYLGLKGIPLAYALATLAQASYYMHYHKKVLGLGIAQILPIKDWLYKALLFAGISFLLHYILTEFVALPAIGTLLISLSIIGIVAASILFKEIKQARSNQ